MAAIAAGLFAAATNAAWLFATQHRQCRRSRLVRFKVKADDFVVQECGAGLVPIRRSSGRLAFAAPPVIRGGPVDGAVITRISHMLGIDRYHIIDAAWVDNGPGWVAPRHARGGDRGPTCVPNVGWSGARLSRTLE